ncbi:MAG: carbon-nitrogen hydrolase family protein [Candidatus Sumerlaeia bacterium]|nr:carbon-nitrogen hydrolase family protein [Candidatus Sumerlaeia bacterium]
MKYANSLIGTLGHIAILALAIFHVAAEEASELTADGWTAASQRPEIAPRFFAHSLPTKTLLGIAGNGNPAANGCWRKTVPVVAGKTYRFSVLYQAKNVELERRSILTRVDWLDSGGRRVGVPDYPATVFSAVAAKSQPVWARIEGLCTAPEKAAKAHLELAYRWDADGEVLWDAVDFQESPRPVRKVRLATVYCRPRNSPSPEASVEKFAEMIRKAAEQKPDFICLGEGITVVGTNKKYVEVAEPIPGPTTHRLAELARLSRAYIVAGIYERDGTTVYNTAVLIGRDGSLVGKYRKAALPREEIDGGLTPGSDYPVFQTEFGKVGIIICWDVFFPTPAWNLASQGAEIIFLPIWGGNQDLIEARAIENQVYLVACGYDAKSAIYDRTGKPIAEANDAQPVAVVEVDLAQPTLWPWLGDYRARIPREAPKMTNDIPIP